VALARELLRQGADPNAFFRNKFGPMSVLYGAAGVRQDPELTALLLEYGADPNGEPHFGDALYHAVEAQDTACLKLLLDYGAQPRGSNALAHAIDDDHVDHVRMLLDAGADPNEGALLVHAVRRGCGLEMVRLLAECGASLNRRGGEWSTVATTSPSSRTWLLPVPELKQRFAEVAQGPLADWLDRETSPDGEQSSMP
jgi:ankyrin repeat protein